MIIIALLAAAAPAPVQLASIDEMRWRTFVRASLERPAPSADRAPVTYRLRQLQGVVEALTEDLPIKSTRGPSGL